MEIMLWVRPIEIESNLLHRVGNLCVAHEPMPNVAGPCVLNAQQRNSEIDSNYLTIHPPGIGIKGISESVLAIDSRTELCAHGPQSDHG